MARRSTVILLVGSICMLLLGSLTAENDECGDFECIYLPQSCQLSQSCQLTLCYKRIADFIQFKVSYEFDHIQGKLPTNNYIAVGVSKTQRMDDTSLVYCRFPLEDSPAVGLAYTVGRSLRQLNDVQLIKNNVQLIEASTVNNTKSCTFNRQIVPIQMSNKVKQLDDFYYLIVAVGKLDATGEQLTIHDTNAKSKNYPFISMNQVNLSAVVCPEKNRSVSFEVTADQPTVPVKKLLKMLHGSFMITGWWFFCAIAVLSARFLKEHLPEKEFFGVKFWFLVHRTFNVIAFLLCLTGFVLIFVATSGEWAGSEFPAGTHAILGMTASVGMFLQPLLAYFRPSIQDSRRPVFKYIHGMIGYGTLFCSFAAIYMITFRPFHFNFNQDDKYGLAPQVLIILLMACYSVITLCLELNRIYTNLMLHKKTAVSTRHILKLENLPFNLIIIFMVISTTICATLITFIFV